MITSVQADEADLMVTNTRSQNVSTKLKTVIDIPHNHTNHHRHICHILLYLDILLLECICYVLLYSTGNCQAVCRPPLRLLLNQWHSKRSTNLRLMLPCRKKQHRCPKRINHPDTYRDAENSVQILQAMQTSTHSGTPRCRTDLSLWW
jgi:hypothetical protein